MCYNIFGAKPQKSQSEVLYNDSKKTTDGLEHMEHIRT